MTKQEKTSKKQRVKRVAKRAGHWFKKHKKPLIVAASFAVLFGVGAESLTRLALHKGWLVLMD